MIDQYAMLAAYDRVHAQNARTMLVRYNEMNAVNIEMNNSIDKLMSMTEGLVDRIKILETRVAELERKLNEMQGDQ
jgi:hypothetical protein